MEKYKFKSHVEEFLLKDQKNNHITKIDFETHLWDKGLVDSFRMVELILFLEDLLDIDINIESNFITNFHTIEKMYNAFVSNNQTKPGMN